MDIDESHFSQYRTTSRLKSYIFSNKHILKQLSPLRFHASGIRDLAMSRNVFPRLSQLTVHQVSYYCKIPELDIGFCVIFNLVDGVG